MAETKRNTRQVIQKWKTKTDSECQAYSECDEYEVKIEQSRKLYVAIIPVNKVEEVYFRLVLCYKKILWQCLSLQQVKLIFNIPFKLK